MPEAPYTDDDLIAEAARQHKILTEDPDFMGIGEQMEGREQWDALDNDAFDAAQRKLDRLLEGAADTSEWAIRCGVDGLEPHREAIDSGPHDGTHVRVHFAFSADIPAEARARYIANARHAITGNA